MQLRDRLQAALGSEYAVEGELGGAGMSRVFVAQETALGRRVVVKVLPPEMTGVSVERFRREIRLAANLQHTNIVPLLSAGEVDGIPYYTTPYVEGRTLRERLRRERQLPIQEAVRIAREIADALGYAHAHGIVHRDIKPENILLSGSHALLTDFGISRAISQAADSDALTQTGIALGTPSYMSPEQASGEHDLDSRSDIYSLGCVLYEMLAGETPFTGPTVQAVIAKHLSGTVTPLRTSRPNVPPELEQVVLRMLARIPADRFTTAAELADALAEACAPGAPRRRGEDQGVTRFVAVLPFENLSSDPENEYFSDGITEDIIAKLSQMSALKVISRTSAMRYKRVQKSVPQIAAELGVSHVLEGSVRRAGNRVRIVAQLVDARSDQHVWAETYDQDLTDVFAIQTEVAERIADMLEARLSPAERSRIVKKPTADLEAYDLYLLGRHHYNKGGADEFAKALDYYRRALARDPQFAAVYAALAVAQHYLAAGYWGLRPHDLYPEVRANAERALAIDPDVGLAHACLGGYHGWYQFDWAAAEADFKRAIELNASDAMVRIYYAIHLAALGRFEEALSERDTATRLDPGSMVVRHNGIWILYLTGRMNDQALREARNLRALDPSSPFPAWCHGHACIQAGEREEAIVAFRDAVRLSDGATLWLICLGYGLAACGEPDGAREVLGEVHRRSKNEYVWPLGLAFAYAHLGEDDRALDYLEQAYADRVGWMLAIGREPLLDRLRRHPRFQALLRAIGPGMAIAEP